MILLSCLAPQTPLSSFFVSISFLFSTLYLLLKLPDDLHCLGEHFVVLHRFLMRFLQRCSGWPESVSRRVKILFHNSRKYRSMKFPFFLLLRCSSFVVLSASLPSLCRFLSSPSPHLIPTLSSSHSSKESNLFTFSFSHPTPLPFFVFSILHNHPLS